MARIMAWSGSCVYHCVDQIFMIVLENIPFDCIYMLVRTSTPTLNSLIRVA